jgi:hypothetical protein
MLKGRKLLFAPLSFFKKIQQFNLNFKSRTFDDLFNATILFHFEMNNQIYIG